jgi:Flp pilus assembly protein TadD
MNDSAEARRLMDRGTALARQGRMDEAALLYQQAIAADPDLAEAHFNLGIARRAVRRGTEAEACWRRALEIEPYFAPARINLGAALLERGDHRAAAAEFRRVLEREPRSVPALVNLGNALRDGGDPGAAAQAYRRAIALQPGFAQAHSNLGLALRELGELAAAEAAYRRALELKPDYALAHRDLGVLLLLLGRYAEGWREFQWRWQARGPERRTAGMPRWSGGDVSGKTVLLHAEQGLGDTIMFCRLAEAVAARGAEVVLEAQPPLRRLLAGLKGAARIAPRADAPPPADCAAALLDLPGILGIDAGNVPARVPYLAPDPGRVRRWRAWLEARPGFRIGVAWQGNPRSDAELGRSPPLAAFRPLAELPGVRLIALQKGPGSEQMSTLPAGMAAESPGEDFDSGPDAFLDSAALMQGLDLVVSADTAPAHLAGALARPVWIALKRVPDWRWGLDRADTPWYPTARLFRQRASGDWAPVFAAMADAAKALRRA